MNHSVKEHAVVFYNVENLYDVYDDRNNPYDEEYTQESTKWWDQERYETKLRMIAEVLCIPDGKAPFAFGLTEIENRRVVEDLIAQEVLKTRNYRIVHFDSDDRRGIDTAFVYDQNILKINTETRIPVRLENQPNFRTRDILYIKGTIHNKTIHFFVNHWASRREGTEESFPRREAAAHILRKEVDELLNIDEKSNILIMGDFNDTPTDKSIYTVLRAKGQHELRSGDLINLLIEEDKRGKGTVVHEREWMVFDQFIVSQGLLQGQHGLSIKDNNAFILKEEALLFTYPDGRQKPNATYRGDTYNGGYSDHLPVFLTIIEAS